MRARTCNFVWHHAADARVRVAEVVVPLLRCVRPLCCALPALTRTLSAQYVQLRAAVHLHAAGLWCVARALPGVLPGMWLSALTLAVLYCRKPLQFALKNRTRLLK